MTGAYRREEFALIALLLLFFAGIVAFSFQSPFDARLFPLVIGGAGMILILAIAIAQLRSRSDAAEMTVEANAAARAGRPRFATALLSAPIFGVAFWLFGFIAAALAAMLAMPVLMGYRDLKRLAVIAVITVAVVAFIAPRLLNVSLPPGLLVEWLGEHFRSS
jgi:Tripartite tricarboxylate transporter TctB family